MREKCIRTYIHTLHYPFCIYVCALFDVLVILLLVVVT